MRVVSVRLSHLAAALLSLATAALVCAYVFSSLSLPAVSAQRLLPIYCVKTTEQKAAISFNCAVSEHDVDEILAILDSHGVRATFFMLGLWAEQYPQSAKKIALAGHEIGNHSYSHDDPTSMSESEILKDIRRCNDAIFSATRVTPRLYRAPSGSYDNKTISCAEKLGMTAVQWDVDTLDWKNISAQEITLRVKNSVKSGSIIQLHTGTQSTAQALGDVLRVLEEKGLEAVCVGELLLDGEYYIDRTGMQIALEDAQQSSEERSAANKK